jgi:hypothetical protein
MDGPGRTFGLLAVALVTGAWFVLRSARHARPLLELHLLRLPRFGVAGGGTFVFGVAFAIMLLSNVLWCQDVWHWSALRTGVALVPGPALVPIVTVLTARVVRRVGHGPLVAAGGALFAAGMLWRAVWVSPAPHSFRDDLRFLVAADLAGGRFPLACAHCVLVGPLQVLAAPLPAGLRRGVQSSRFAADECIGGPPRWSTGKWLGGAAFGLITYRRP